MQTILSASVDQRAETRVIPKAVAEAVYETLRAFDEDNAARKQELAEDEGQKPEKLK